ncbi:MAG: hypothetical protein GEV10_11680 [Streptosporangiales bacterium]|nr:hypothetical protein [Streptosporangiales bacterium]
MMLARPADSHCARPVASPFALPIGFAALLVAAAALTGQTEHSQPERIVVMVSITTGVAANARLRDAIPLAVLGWLFTNGFIIHQFGELGWQTTTEPTRVGVFACAAVVGALCGHLLRIRPHRTRDPRHLDPAKTRRGRRGT